MSKEWSFDPSRARLSQEAALACDLRFDLDDEHWLRLLKFGSWWVLPIARTYADELIGIRLEPGRALIESPVVRLERHEAATLVSRPAFLLPRRILSTTMGGGEYWDRARDLPESVWSELGALHASFGGTDGLSGVREVLANPEFRAATIDKFNTLEDFNRLFPKMLMAVDPESAAFREYAEHAVTTFEAPTPIPDLGCWKPAAAVMSFVANGMAVWEGRKEADRLAAAWEVVQNHPGLDSCQSHLPAHLFWPSGNSATGAPFLAARLLVDKKDALPAAWRNEPVWQAVEALVAAADNYKGGAHLAAVEEYARAGKREQAFTMLTSAAYWIYVRTREPFPQLHEAAQILASESGWSELQQTLVYIAKMINQAE